MAIATVTIELCPEDRKRLDDILAALTNAGTPYQAPAAEKPAAKQQETPPWETAQPDPQPEKAPEIPPVDRKEVQNAVVKLIAEGKKDEARKIVKSYANSVTEIPEDKLAEVLNALTALGDTL